MNFPIIDVSKQSVAQFATGCSRGKALQFVAWYRVIRPALLVALWVLSATYIRWCLDHASEAELSLQALMPVITGIVTVSAAMILWTGLRQIDLQSTGRVRRMPDNAGASHHPLSELPMAVDAGRCLVAYHDDDGMISRVVSMPEYAQQAA